MSKRPQTPRPSLFDFTNRAKWDAWDKLGSESDGEEGWINRYLEIARSLGWKEEGSAELHGSDPLENIVKSEVNKGNEGGGVEIGRHVSVLSTPDIPVEDTLHGRVLENDASRVVALLDVDPSANVNAKDEYVSPLIACFDRKTFKTMLNGQGYTPLHLAADRGHKNMVAILLQKGADVSVKVSLCLVSFFFQVLSFYIPGCR